VVSRFVAVILCLSIAGLLWLEDCLQCVLGERYPFKTTASTACAVARPQVAQKTPAVATITGTRASTCVAAVMRTASTYSPGLNLQ